MTESQKPVADAVAAAEASTPSPRRDSIHPSLPPAVRAAIARREAAADASSAQRTRPLQLGGVRLKLEVFTLIEGYHLYWANDQNNEVEMLIEEGFDIVKPEEVGMANRIVQDADVANIVTKYVGTKEDGTPLRAYLLKIPEEQWQAREDHRYAQADEWDEGIRQGSISNVEGRYKPQGAAISLKTR